jgi:hypothetical protein
MSKSPVVDSDSDDESALETPVIDPKQAETHLEGLDDVSLIINTYLSLYI